MDVSHWNLPNSFWALSTALRYLVWHLKHLPRKVATSIVFPSCLQGLKTASVRRVTWGCKSSQSIAWAGFSSYLIVQGIFILRKIFNSLWADSEWRLRAQSNGAAVQSREQLAGLISNHHKQDWSKWHSDDTLPSAQKRTAFLRPIMCVKSPHISYTLGSDPLARIMSVRFKAPQNMHSFLLQWKGTEITPL